MSLFIHLLGNRLFVLIEQTSVLEIFKPLETNDQQNVCRCREMPLRIVQSNAQSILFLIFSRYFTMSNNSSIERGNSYLCFDNISKITSLSLSRSNLVVRNKCYTLYICLYSFFCYCLANLLCKCSSIYICSCLSHTYTFIFSSPSSLLFTSIEMRHCHSRSFHSSFLLRIFFSFDR